MFKVSLLNPNHIVCHPLGSQHVLQQLNRLDRR